MTFTVAPDLISVPNTSKIELSFNTTFHKCIIRVQQSILWVCFIAGIFQTIVLGIIYVKLDRENNVKIYIYIFFIESFKRLVINGVVLSKFAVCLCEKGNRNKDENIETSQFLCKSRVLYLFKRVYLVHRLSLFRATGVVLRRKNTIHIFITKICTLLRRFCTNLMCSFFKVSHDLLSKMPTALLTN